MFKPFKKLAKKDTVATKAKAVGGNPFAKGKVAAKPKGKAKPAAKGKAAKAKASAKSERNLMTQIGGFPPMKKKGKKSFSLFS